MEKESFDRQETEEALSRARALGELAARNGRGEEMLLGLLDGGLDLGHVIESLVMHGDLPSIDEREEGQQSELRLKEQPAGEWKVAS